MKPLSFTRGKLAWLLLAALLVPPFAALAAERPPAPLNFVLILADDLGWADLRCYGSDLHETPHLDRLASQGVRFTDAYAAQTVCSPTRASLLTGKHPARLHLTIWREGALNPPRNRRLLPPPAIADLPHGETTIAELLQRSGWLTAITGKWHLGDAGGFPETHGFDVNIGGTHWGAPNTYWFPYSGAGAFGGEFRYVPHLEFGPPGEYLTDRLADEALRVIDRAGERPFFLYLAHHAPHTPIEAKTNLVAHYEKKISPSLHHRNAAYAAMVQSLDESVGRVLAKLEERKLADRTVVIFTSDNGGFVNQFKGQQVTDNFPLRSGKGSLYEGGVRVPLIVRWPGVTPAGAVCREPVVLTDLFFTMREIAEVKAESGDNAPADGLSLVPLLKNPSAQLPRDTLYFHYPHYYQTTTPVSALRAGDWKLLEYHEDQRVELYDLKNDFSEQRDLAKEQSAKAAELREKLHAWRSSVGAQMPTVNPDFRPGKEKGKGK